MKCFSKSEEMNYEHFINKTKNGLTVFPHVEVALRIYLIIKITNCTGKLPFSELKIIKNKLKTTMNQNRLNYLSILSIECNVLDNVLFKNIINDFSEKKMKKCNQ